MIRKPASIAISPLHQTVLYESFLGEKDHLIPTQNLDEPYYVLPFGLKI